MTDAARSMLIYGTTGRAGLLVAKRALAEGWNVSAFVRNPDKVPEALRSKVRLIKGDLRDATSVAEAVRSSLPNAIVDASSALPFGTPKGQPKNNADRGIVTRATLKALEEDERLEDCVLLVIGGQLLPEPGGTIDKWSVAAMAWIIGNLVMRKEWREAEEMLRWTFEDTPKAFRFVYARLGQMVETPTRGALRAEATAKNIQHGSVSYCDVADALVSLASDEKRTWERKALFFNYATA